jgi:hypothetical protein
VIIRGIKLSGQISLDKSISRGQNGRKAREQYQRYGSKTK